MVYETDEVGFRAQRADCESPWEISAIFGDTFSARSPLKLTDADWMRSYASRSEEEQLFSGPGAPPDLSTVIDVTVTGKGAYDVDSQGKVVVEMFFPQKFEIHARDPQIVQHLNSELSARFGAWLRENPDLREMFLKGEPERQAAAESLDRFNYAPHLP